MVCCGVRFISLAHTHNALVQHSGLCYVCTYRFIILHRSTCKVFCHILGKCLLEELEPCYSECNLHIGNLCRMVNYAAANWNSCLLNVCGLCLWFARESFQVIILSLRQGVLLSVHGCYYVGVCDDWLSMQIKKLNATSAPQLLMLVESTYNCTLLADRH